MTLSDILGRSLALLAVLVLGGGLIAVTFARSRELYGSGDGQRERQINCPSCGTRLPADSESCTHCGEPLQP